MAQAVIEALSLVITLLLAIWSYKRMPNYYRVFFLQLLLWICTYIFSYLVTIYQEYHGITKNNQWVFNIYIPIETGLLLLAAAIYLKQSFNRMFSLILFLLFVIIFFFEIAYKGFQSFAVYSFVTECFFISAMYSIVLFDQFEKHGSDWFRAPLVYICIGNISYFLCNVPYISLLSYFQRQNPEVNKMLFSLITDVLANLRYLLMALAFWLLNHNSQPKKIIYNG